MKTNVTLRKNTKKLFNIILMIFPVLLQAQPDYIFRNAVLEYGTDLQIGAKYRFPNVRPGIDGILEIKDLTGGMTLNQLDGGSGFDEALQPYINCAPKKKGYVEFELNLVASGTYTNVTVPELPLSAIDIDGWQFPDDKLYETDEFEHSSSYYTKYDLLGTSLDIKEASGWTSVINKTAITYDGIDTIQRDVMFTAVHANVTKVLFRVGAENKSKEPMTRLRSVYFKKFDYETALLPIFFLKEFSGNLTDEMVKLTWSFQKGIAIRNYQLEKSTDGRNFQSAMQKLASAQDQGTGNTMQERMTTPVVYYRMRVNMLDGKVEYSKILMFRNNATTHIAMKIYPTIVQSDATLQMYSTADATARYAIYDQSGRMMQQRNVQLAKGQNSITMQGLDALSRGHYVVVLNTQDQQYTSRILRN